MKKIRYAEKGFESLVYRSHEDDGNPCQCHHGDTRCGVEHLRTQRVM